MLNKEQENFIKQYINKEIFDVEKVIYYLQLHDIVGEEIFEIAQKENKYYGRLITHGYGYNPISTDVFVRRIPFYFYTPEFEHDMLGDLSDIIISIYKLDTHDIKDNNTLEELYGILEKMFYVRGMSIRDIMNYAHKISHTNYEGEFFYKWAHYLDLCDKLHIDNKYPKNFLFETNRVLKMAGEEPDIFEPGYVGFNEPYIRDGNEIIVGGEFPYTEDNQAALQWIGVWLENAAYVKVCDAYGMDEPKFIEKELHIGLTPSTKIYLPNTTKDNKLIWEPIYFGPLVMEFDNSTLKKFRKRAKLTQKIVAESIGIQIRTYQKWEKGEVKPDGYNLIRLMNFLDISSVQDFLKNTPIEDDINYTKFRNRKKYN